jgi:hypothetical protein
VKLFDESKEKPRKDILRCLGVKGVARRRGRRRFEILIERDNRLPGRGFVCLCLLLFWLFHAHCECVLYKHAPEDQVEKRRKKRFWLPMSAYGAVINEGIRLLTQRRVKREPASCTQPVQSCCFISFFLFYPNKKEREETGGIFSTGNVWQRRQDEDTL